ncbi:MAG: hypothetical protein LBJ94_02800 [Puniceicoccales bacterium]|jgi:hypothetical protein|nr:hypothetical protein [Puniceicoccales bacterium]
MLKLAKLAGLAVEYGGMPLFPCFKRVRRLWGNIRGKRVEVFIARPSRIATNMVAQIKLNWHNEVHFSAMRKKLGLALMRVLGRPIVASGDIILDRKITFQSKDMNFAKRIFAYEEIRDKFDALWTDKLSGGVLLIGQSSIFYREPASILTRRKRARFAIAIDLLCDLFDILYFYRYKIS